MVYIGNMPIWNGWLRDFHDHGDSYRRFSWCLIRNICHTLSIIHSSWEFPKMGIPNNGWFTRDKSIYKWMMTGGTPILGNHHIFFLYRWYIMIYTYIHIYIYTYVYCIFNIYIYIKLEQKHYWLLCFFWQTCVLFFFFVYSYQLYNIQLAKNDFLQDTRGPHVASLGFSQHAGGGFTP